MNTGGGMFEFLFAGCATLCEQLDKRVAVVLVDNRLIIGDLVSYDQFCNIVLRSPIERRTCGKAYSDSDLPGAIILCRSSYLAFGDYDEHDASLASMTRVSDEEMNDLLEKQREASAARVAAIMAAVPASLARQVVVDAEVE